MGVRQASHGDVNEAFLFHFTFNLFHGNRTHAYAYLLNKTHQYGFLGSNGTKQSSKQSLNRVR